MPFIYLHPVFGIDEIVCYDIFVDDIWWGSRRTERQCWQQILAECYRGI